MSNTHAHAVEPGYVAAIPFEERRIRGIYFSKHPASVVGLSVTSEEGSHLMRRDYFDGLLATSSTVGGWATTDVIAGTTVAQIDTPDGKSISVVSSWGYVEELGDVGNLQPAEFVTNRWGETAIPLPLYGVRVRAARRRAARRVRQLLQKTSDELSPGVAMLDSTQMFLHTLSPGYHRAGWENEYFAQLLAQERSE